MKKCGRFIHIIMPTKCETQSISKIWIQLTDFRNYKFQSEASIWYCQDYCFSNWKYTGYLNDPITLEEITDEASKLKAGKAAGPDGITNTSINQH